MFDTKTAYWTSASTLSDCVLLTFPKKMHGTETVDLDWSSERMAKFAGFRSEATSRLRP